MSTRILFADDSMTAQNMGKRILTDAGYDVIAVSNGAAAVKKIAEQKPDIIILDVYMPGYTGLEVCEKVRASMDTLKTPVLLTVGKMEPYRPEDANRVRADGVIIKPFEATDLLAIVKKLEERIVPKTVALAEQTVLLERPPEFTQPPREEIEVHAHAPEPAQGIVDVPDHMATAAAFSDLLGMDSSHALDPIPHPKPIPEAELAPLEPEPELKAAASLSEEPAGFAPAPEFHSMPVTQKPYPPAEEAIKIAPPGYAIDDTQPIPVDEEPEAEAHPPELEIVAVEEEEESSGPARPAFHVEAAKPVEPEPEPEESVSPEPPPREMSAPPKPVFFAPRTEIRPQFSAFTTKTATESEPSVGEARRIELEPARPQANNGLEPREAEKPAASAEDEFEARVAAAMSIYDEPVEEKTRPEPAIAAEKKPDSEIEVSPEPAPFTFVPETPFSFEYGPPIAAPDFHPMPEAKAEPEHHEIAPRPLPEPEIEPVARVVPVSSVFEKPDAFAESSFFHTEVSYKAVEISEHHAVTARPAPQAEIEPEPPAFLAATPFVHEEVSSPAVEKVVELPAAAFKPAAEREAESRKPEVTESRPPVHEEVSSAVVEKIAAGIEAELPAVAAASAAEIGSDTQLISNVVHRVMERLKPELIQEISRELKSKK